jgi:hypothetical protein
VLSPNNLEPNGESNKASHIWTALQNITFVKFEFIKHVLIEALK